MFPAIVLALAASAQDGKVKEAARRNRLAHELAGRVALEKKDYQTAAAELDQANGQDPRVLFLRALAVKGNGDQAGALALARKAAEFNSINNVNYAFVRRDAQRFVESAQKG
jgi:hypothetical protein